jgi:hypothetical protein
VANDIVGRPGRRRSKISCAVGWVSSDASSRTIAIRWGVSFNPAARTPASILSTFPSSLGFLVAIQKETILRIILK